MKKIKVIIGLLFGALSFAPLLAFAQQSAGNINTSGGLSSVLDSLWYLLDRAVPILIALAVVIFLFGVLKFIFNAGNEEERTKGRNFMIWAIIGIVVMVSVWGLVYFVQNTFGLSNNNGFKQSQLNGIIPKF